MRTLPGRHTGLCTHKDYWDDQSAFSFARVLDKFPDWHNSADANPQSDPCRNGTGMISPTEYPLIFRNTFLVAAGIVNESLEKGRPGRADLSRITECCRLPCLR